MALAKFVHLGFLILSYLSFSSARWVFIDSINVKTPNHAHPSPKPKTGASGAGAASGDGGGNWYPGNGADAGPGDGAGDWYPSDPPSSGSDGGRYPSEPPSSGSNGGWYPSEPPCSGSGSGWYPSNPPSGGYVGSYPAGGSCPTTPYQPIACPIGCQPAFGQPNMAVQQWVYQLPIRAMTYMPHVDRRGHSMKSTNNEYNVQVQPITDDQKDRDFAKPGSSQMENQDAELESNEVEMKNGELRPNKKRVRDGEHIASEPITRLDKITQEHEVGAKKQERNSEPIANKKFHHQ